MSSKPLQNRNNNPIWMALVMAAMLALAGALGWWLRLTQSEPSEPAVLQAAVASEALPAELASIALDPAAVPDPVGYRAAQLVKVTLEAKEVVGKLADGTAYTYWTFGGQVPGPMLRVRQGDTVEVRFVNPETNIMPHSIDFHAATGQGGGGAVSQAMPGETKVFRFKALTPGLFVYHCATPLAAMHIANGQYGLILVEPPQGLSKVDREFYVMQGELYTAQPNGTPGKLSFDPQKLLDERPEYFVFNGATDALTAQHPLRAEVGETVRILFGVGGPNFISTFHVIGEIFDTVYDQSSLVNPLRGVQSAITGPGSASIVEFKLDYPGKYLLVDHALSRAGRGLVGHLEVGGKADPGVFETLTPVSGGSGH